MTKLALSPIPDADPLVEEFIGRASELLERECQTGTSDGVTVTYVSTGSYRICLFEFLSVNAPARMSRGAKFWQSLEARELGQDDDIFLIRWRDRRFFDIKVKCEWLEALVEAMRNHMVLDDMAKI